jgi:hypothetical protein
MVGRNVLGMQPVGERLLAKISDLYVFYLMYYVVYLIIFDICNLMFLSVYWLFFVHGTLFISFMMWHGSCLMNAVCMLLKLLRNPFP